MSDERKDAANPAVLTAPTDGEENVAKPNRKPPRPYFARLDPQKDLTKQMTARIVQYLTAESDENGRVVYMVLYHGAHGERYVIGMAEICGKRH